VGLLVGAAATTGWHAPLRADSERASVSSSAASPATPWWRVRTGCPARTSAGLIGRRAGSLPGFRFSPALIGAGGRGLVWTRESLDAYLADPERFIPGHRDGAARAARGG
jgi:hypothetical protein